MVRLDKALHAWGTPGFEDVLKLELVQLGAEGLPLQQGLSGSSYATDKPVTVVINSIVELPEVIRVKAGIFYQGVIAGCSCADDPTPVGEIDEYCEVQLDIDKFTATTAIALLGEAPD
ncbi:MAG: hypothetical protein HZB47_00885 [Nitrosomonadales bacterium]|nr:hypothetical protein [Nitrosomonadales bacterium]